MRKEFHPLLLNYMKQDSQITLITPDMGYKFLDAIEEQLPEQFLKFRAAEQGAMGAAIGLALEGKICLIYSIDPFITYRPIELIRNYLDFEEIPVKIIGGGRMWDYGQGDVSHKGDGIKAMRIFDNIQCFLPKDVEEMTKILPEFLYNGKPCYLNLKR